MIILLSKFIFVKHVQEGEGWREEGSEGSEGGSGGRDGVMERE